MVKLIASDLDGTLLRDYEQIIPEETLDVLRELHEKGIIFVAASGRQYANMRKLFAPLGYEIPFISENGSLCIYNNEIISTGSIPKETIEHILEGLYEYREQYHTGHCIFSVPETYMTDSTDERFLTAMKTRKNNISFIEDLGQVKGKILKIAICDFGGTQYLEPFFKERVGDEIRCATAAGEWLDFIAPDANKGIALQNVLKKFGIKRDECICFGDQSNDVEMLKTAGTSYAMETAVPEAKEAADHVVPSVLSVLKTLL